MDCIKLLAKYFSQGIEVLLVYLPFPAGEQAQMDANRVYDIAIEYGVNCVNFRDMDIVDYYTDCYDANSHLNPSGARKVTHYLGQYILEHYNISDQRTNETYADWFGDYEEYVQLKISQLKEQEILDNYLMLLSDKNYNIILEISNHDIWRNEYYARLLENLGIDSEMVTDQIDFVVIGGDGIRYILF